MKNTVLGPREALRKEDFFSYAALAFSVVPDGRIILEVLKIIVLITAEQRSRFVGIPITVREYSYSNM